MDHTEYRYSAVLLGVEGLPFGQHRIENVKIGLRKYSFSLRKVLDLRSVLPGLGGEGSERLPGPAIKSCGGVLHLVDLIDEVLGLYSQSGKSACGMYSP